MNVLSTASNTPARLAIAEIAAMSAICQSARVQEGQCNNKASEQRVTCVTTTTLAIASKPPKTLLSPPPHPSPLTFSVGLVGVSIQISFVFGVMAASSAATLVRSTKSNVMPDAACTMRLAWRNARHP